MKIGLTSYFHPLNSPFGVAVHVHNLAKEMTIRGHEVHVFTSQKCSTNDNLPYYTHILKVKSAGAHYKDVMDFTCSTAQKMKHMDFDVIGSHGWNALTALSTELLLLTPIVHTIHSVERYKSQWNDSSTKNLLQTEMQMRRAHRLIAVSKSVKADAVKAYHIAPSQIRIIPNGVDTELFRPTQPTNKLFAKYGIPKQKQVLLYIGRDEPAKGADLLAEVATKVLEKRNDVLFLNIMPFSKAKPLMRVAKRHPKNIFVIKTPVSQKALSELHSLSSLYLQPSRYESFCLAALEAMACAKPVLAFPVGGLAKVVSHKITGFHCSSINDMASRVIRLLDDDSLRARLGANARRKALDYSWKTMAMKTIRVYKSACS